MLGATIGGYVVRAKLATGGMGAVYVAAHATLDKRVAIKVLLPEMSLDRTVVTRFFNEAKAASAIRHPSIVEIHDFGYTPDNQAYIIMELLEGENLASRCKRAGKLEPRRAMLFARQIAGALAAAHDLDIVHRDLKPDNVFIVPDPEVSGGERIKLLDFGVAKLHKNLDETALTQMGAVLGTPTYMAPEQCRGAGGVDARADLYSLGCVLYEMLLGRPPFTHDGAGGVMAHHLYFEPDAPRKLDPSLPESIEEIVLWLLRKDPAHRPQSARELVTAIDRSGFGSELATPPAGMPTPVPTVPVPTTLTGASGIKTPTLETRRSQRWIAPVVAAACIVAGIAIYVAAGSGEERHVAAPVVADPAPAPAPPPAATVVKPTPPPSVRLVVDSDPAGASVLVDGKPVGTTPYVETLDAHSGSHSYTVQKTGYETATAKLDTDRDNTTLLVLKKKPTHHARPHTTTGVGDRAVNPFD